MWGRGDFWSARIMSRGNRELARDQLRYEIKKLQYARDEMALMDGRLPNGKRASIERKPPKQRRQGSLQVRLFLTCGERFLT